VKNPQSTPTAAIHVYGGDFFATPRSEWNPETQEERASSGEGSRELFLRVGGIVTTDVTP
jgi:predicted metal-dependent enzyme (double-stranded beta helix superfamily)